MLKCFSENCQGDERTYIDKEGNEIINSWRILFLAHSSCGFDNRVVLKSLANELNVLKTIRTAGGLISLSFRCNVKIVSSDEVPQNIKFTCTRLLVSGFLDKIGRECGLLPEILKRDISYSKITN